VRSRGHAGGRSQPAFFDCARSKEGSSVPEKEDLAL